MKKIDLFNKRVHYDNFTKALEQNDCNEIVRLMPGIFKLAGEISFNLKTGKQKFKPKELEKVFLINDASVKLACAQEQFEDTDYRGIIKFVLTKENFERNKIYTKYIPRTCSCCFGFFDLEFNSNEISTHVNLTRMVYDVLDNL